MAKAKLDCAMEVLRITSEHDVCEMVWWRCDGEYAPVTFLVNVNDQFSPSADAEAITPENLEMFVRAIEDCVELDEQSSPKSEDIRDGKDGFATSRADVLFVARFRKTRLWKRKHERYPPKMLPLLLAAGETGYGWESSA